MEKFAIHHFTLLQMCQDQEGSNHLAWPAVKTFQHFNMLYVGLKTEAPPPHQVLAA
jgi:hypothetical protein